jgi:hypothetical protein
VVDIDRALVHLEINRITAYEALAMLNCQKADLELVVLLSREPSQIE